MVNKTAIPPCPDEPSKKVFEQAITGALCKFYQKGAFQEDPSPPWKVTENSNGVGG